MAEDERFSGAAAFWQKRDKYFRLTYSLKGRIMAIEISRRSSGMERGNPLVRIRPGFTTIWKKGAGAGAEETEIRELPDEGKRLRNTPLFERKEIAYPERGGETPVTVNISETWASRIRNKYTNINESVRVNHLDLRFGENCG